ncbi:MAG: DNA-protecting protein DprA [Anaerolinea sp.]|nr:DNA-protecting protein DprA [Anaerolinea sp.]
MDQKAYWVGFNLVKGIGAVRLQLLIQYFGSPEAAWNATAGDLYSVGLPQRIVDGFLDLRKTTDPLQVYEDILKKGFQVMTRDDDNYPEKLSNIDHPPPVIYLRGTIKLEDRWAVAMVGTRRVTSYGRQVTEQVATYLARNGMTVVSGLARGVDGVAHQSALSSGGRTIAVLGSGLDQIYPGEHRQLAERICENGAVISDYPPGTPPDAANFPPRNRIIAGLSMATVVVEAGEHSGALITATFAAEQGREVFAVPGPIYAPQSRGTNRLIREGAQPLLEPADILESLNLRKVDQYKQASLLLPVDELEAKLMEILNLEPVYIDEIQAKVGYPVEKVSAALTMMELKGMVRQVSGMTYMATREENEQYRVR